MMIGVAPLDCKAAMYGGRERALYSRSVEVGSGMAILIGMALLALSDSISFA